MPRITKWTIDEKSTGLASVGSNNSRRSWHLVHIESDRFLVSLNHTQRSWNSNPNKESGWQITLHALGSANNVVLARIYSEDELPEAKKKASWFFNAITCKQGDQNKQFYEVLNWKSIGL